MPKVKGILSVPDLKRLAARGEINTVILAFTDLYGRFMGKRLDIDFFLDEGLKRGTHACDYLLTVDMDMEPVPGYAFTNWEKGYGDVHLVPDLSTLRIASWLPKTAFVICDVVDDRTGGPVAVAPRSILNRQTTRAKSMGFTAMAASELEYYLFQNSFRDAASKAYRDLQPAGWYLEDYHILQGTREESFNGAARRHLQDSGIPVENSKGEWGLGQHELNIRYADAVEMADRHALFKQCLKEIADSQGISVTFMAKFSAQQAGSSCHVHLSLWKGGRNAFTGKKKLGPVQCSDVFRWFLGGWMAHTPELMVFYASNVNAYKRYQAASWAPTRLAWSFDNRTAGFRVVGGDMDVSRPRHPSGRDAGQSGGGRKDDSLRIECRIPGADCNPYLVYSAAIASGLDGIANRIEPPPMHEGDVYAAKKIPHVPRSLRDATALFEESPFVRKTFGADVVDHYVHFFRTEQNAYDRAVTDWERQRYFERA